MTDAIIETCVLALLHLSVPDLGTRMWDVRQGPPVYQQSVGRSIASPRHGTTLHHGLSSPVQCSHKTIASAH